MAQTTKWGAIKEKNARISGSFTSEQNSMYQGEIIFKSKSWLVCLAFCFVYWFNKKNFRRVKLLEGAKLEGSILAFRASNIDRYLKQFLKRPTNYWTHPSPLPGWLYKFACFVWSGVSLKDFQEMPGLFLVYRRCFIAMMLVCFASIGEFDCFVWYDFKFAFPCFL